MKALVVSSYYALADPTSRGVCLSLQSRGATVRILQPGVGKSTPHTPIEGVEATDSPVWSLPAKLRRLEGPLKSLLYAHNARKLIRASQPDIVVTTTLNDLAALPEVFQRRSYRSAAAILDVPVPCDAGVWDRRLHRVAWDRLRSAEVVWASDVHKARLAQEYGALDRSPIVCHNCPPDDYLPDVTGGRDPWLRERLIGDGATISDHGGCIVLRAGAIGPACGLEETLTAMENLPQDLVFLMMGRPSKEYNDAIVRRISELRLERRAFLWDRPSDEIWKKALRGADIGHMIHGPFAPGRAERAFQHNSSLSNYRLFFYMAASLPIVAFDDPRMAPIYEEVDAFSVARISRLTEDLREGLLHLYENAERRQVMGRNGRSAHCAKYNWKTQFQPVLDKLLA